MGRWQLVNIPRCRNSLEVGEGNFERRKNATSDEEGGRGGGTTIDRDA